MRANEANETELQLNGQKDKSKQEELVQNEPKAVYFIILEGTEDSAVAGGMEVREGGDAHDNGRNFDVCAQAEKRDYQADEETHCAGDDPDEGKGSASYRHKAFAVLGYFADKHPGQAGVSHIANEHGKSEDERILAELAHADGMGNDQDGSEVNQATDD